MMFLDRILAIFELAVIRAEVICGWPPFGHPSVQKEFFTNKTKEKERRG
jgi:hypothetical protein